MSHPLLRTVDGPAPRVEQINGRPVLRSWQRHQATVVPGVDVVLDDAGAVHGTYRFLPDLLIYQVIAPRYTVDHPDLRYFCRSDTVAAIVMTSLYRIPAHEAGTHLAHRLHLDRDPQPGGGHVGTCQGLGLTDTRCPFTHTGSRQEVLTAYLHHSSNSPWDEPDAPAPEPLTPQALRELLAQPTRPTRPVGYAAARLAAARIGPTAAALIAWSTDPKEGVTGVLPVADARLVFRFIKRAPARAQLLVATHLGSSPIRPELDWQDVQGPDDILRALHRANQHNPEPIDACN